MNHIDAFADAMRILPLEDLAPIAQALADRLHEHRMGNGGRTPRALWKSCVEIGPSYACIELVLKLCNPDGTEVGAMLKSRDPADQGFEEKLTIPGVSLMPTETLMQAANRLMSEFTDDEELRQKLTWSIFITKNPFVEVHREDTDPTVEGRRANCMTAVFVAKITPREMMRLFQSFAVVTPDKFDSLSIVDHHRTTLRAIYE